MVGRHGEVGYHSPFQLHPSEKNTMTNSDLIVKVAQLQRGFGLVCSFTLSVSKTSAVSISCCNLMLKIFFMGTEEAPPYK